MNWDDGIYYDTILEAQLEASLKAARRTPVEVAPAAHTHTLNPISAPLNRISTLTPETTQFRVIQSFAPESEPTDADLKLMEDLDQELKDFAKLVKAGLA